MAGGMVGAAGLTETLSRAEPTVVNRTYDYKDLSSVEVLLTPKDVVRRSGRSLWHYGRPKFPLGLASERAGQQLANGLYAGTVVFPEKCAVCLVGPSAGVVYELKGALLEGGSARFKAKDVRVVIAANWERTWYSVPFCETHAKKQGGVAFGETLNNLGWVTFRNTEYGAEFGDLNGLEPRHFARRWWAVLLGVALLLLALGVGNLATMNSVDEQTAGSPVAGAVLLVLGIVLLAYLYKTLVAPWRARRESDEMIRPPEPKAAGAHKARGDGYCAHCHQPWPCVTAREAGAQ